MGEWQINTEKDAQHREPSGKWKLKPQRHSIRLLKWRKFYKWTTLNPDQGAARLWEFAGGLAKAILEKCDSKGAKTREFFWGWIYAAHNPSPHADRQNVPGTQPRD